MAKRRRYETHWITKYFPSFRYIRFLLCVMRFLRTMFLEHNGMSFHALRWETSLELSTICLNLQEEEKWEVIPGRNNCCFLMRYFVRNLQRVDAENIFFFCNDIQDLSLMPMWLQEAQS